MRLKVVVPIARWSCHATITVIYAIFRRFRDCRLPVDLSAVRGNFKASTVGTRMFLEDATDNNDNERR